MPGLARRAVVVAVLGASLLARGAAAHDEHGSGGPAITGAYTLARELHGSAPSSGALHGSSIAVGRLNHLIAVGSPGVSKVYLHDRSTGAVVRVFTSPNPTAGDGFGSALAADGQRLLIGAPFDDTAGLDAGAAYLFDMETGAALTTFLNPTPAALDGFGQAVAFSATRPLIGAPGDDTAGLDAGAVYLFPRSPSPPVTLTKPPPIGISEFGRSLIGLSGTADYIVVGDPADGGEAAGGGAVFVFEDDGPLRYRLANPNPTAGASFGASLAGAGTPRRLVVGAPALGASPAIAGRVDVFDLDTGAYQRTLVSGASSAGDEFGGALVGLGFLVLAGAPMDDTGAPDAGAAHLFDATTGVLLRTLPNPTPSRHDAFGFAAAASCNLFVVGAPRERTDGPQSGEAYLYLPTLAPCSVSGSPDQVGEWGPLVSTPAIATHAAVMGNGDVLFWRGEPAPAKSYVFDPETGVIEQRGATTNRTFCSGLATLADGRVIAVGGGPTNGILDTYVFDPEQAEPWTRLSDMHQPRWYPTATTLGDGHVLATSGHIVPGVQADIPEIYDVASDTWTQLASASLPAVGNYPFMFLLPNGRLFQAGHRRTSTQTRTLSLATKTWTDVAPSPTSFGTAVMFRPGRVLKTGGFESGLIGNRADWIDMNAASPAWVRTASMRNPRQEHNLVMLPDGNVLAVGGRIASDTALEAIPAAEIWNPATEVWTQLACAAEPRMYHSTALLLPDGRVLAAGGDCYPSYQIYSPPYLFRGPRPTIDVAPASVEIATYFAVETPESATIQSVALLRPGATTHGWDMNQRYVPLSFVRGPGWLQVNAPATTNVAPPGDYMLYVVDANGIPSTAHMLRITGDPPACSNALDDDDDGLVDDELDPGCMNVASDSESVQCQDGVDNDRDGSIDFDGGASVNGGVPLGAPDPSCTQPWGNRENPPLPGSCGLGAESALVLGALAAWVRSRARRGRGPRSAIPR